MGTRTIFHVDFTINNYFQHSSDQKIFPRYIERKPVSGDRLPLARTLEDQTDVSLKTHPIHHLAAERIGYTLGILRGDRSRTCFSGNLHSSAVFRMCRP